MIPFFPSKSDNQVVTPAAVSASVTINTVMPSIRFANSGTKICYAKIGTGNIVATTSDIPILPGESVVIGKGDGNDKCAYISAEGTTLNIQSGIGGVLGYSAPQNDVGTIDLVNLTTLLVDTPSASTAPDYLVAFFGSLIKRISGNDYKAVLKVYFDTVYSALIHASRHKHGGADEISTATPAANVIPKTGAANTLAPGFLPAATTSAQGAVELAIATELVTGTDDARSPSVKQLKDSVILHDLLSAGMWLPKLSKMTDGTMALTGNDAFASADFDAVGAITLSIVATPGTTRFTRTDTGSLGGGYKAVSGPLGKYVVVRYRTSDLTTVWNFNNYGGSGAAMNMPSFVNSLDWCYRTCPLPIKEDSTTYNGLYISSASGASGAWIEVDAFRVADDAFYEGTITLEGVKIARDIGSVMAAGNAATQILDFTDTIVDGNTFTVYGKTFTFKDALTPTEGQILIGGSNAAAIANAGNAINHTGTPDTDYKCAAVHTYVKATAWDTTSLTIRRWNWVTGAEVRSSEWISVSENNANMAWRGAKLLGGYSDTEAKVLAQVRAADQGNFLSTRFKDKFANFLGDSVTAYVSDGTVAFPDLVKTLLGLSLARNYGVGGSKITVDGGDPDSFVERYAAMEDNADLIVVLGGYNDYGVTIGLESSVDTTEFYGALNVLLDGLKTKYVGKEIVIMTPYQSSATDYVAYRNAIINRAQYYGIPCLDLWTMSGMSINRIAADSTLFTADGLHPNAAGKQRIANRLGHFIAATL